MASAALTASANLTIDFESPDYAPGQLSGQGSWTVDATEVALSNIVAGQHLALSGSSSPGPKMNRWIATPVTLTGSTYVGMDFNMAASGNTDPQELFLGLTNNAATNGAPWNAYVALKYPNSGTIGIEGTGSGGVLADASILLNTNLTVGALFTVNGLNQVSGISVWINPTLGIDGLPTNGANQSWSIAVPANDLTAYNLFKLRAQNMPTTIDNISIINVVPEPSTYAAILGLMALGVVAWRRRK
jgi:hypothetical protein